MLIFDFNGTLYDSKSGQLVPDCKQVLNKLKPQYTLILLSGSSEERKNKATELLGSYFKEMVFVSEKSEKVIWDILYKYHASPTSCTLIGDTFTEEILRGIKVGCNTIFISPNIVNNKNIPATHTFSKIKNILEVL